MDRGEPAILIVDDDPDVCHNMSDILSDQGYRVDTAHEGRTGHPERGGAWLTSS